MGSFRHCSDDILRVILTFLKAADILNMMSVSVAVQAIVIKHTKKLVFEHESVYQSIPAKLTNVESLAISDSRVTDASITAITNQCPSLTSLNVCGCTQLTDASITAIANQCPSLTSLNVCGCTQLTDASITAITNQCPSLTSLNVCGCTQLTDASITELQTSVLR